MEFTSIHTKKWNLKAVLAYLSDALTRERQNTQLLISNPIKMKNYITLMMVFIATSVFAQKMKIVEGDFDFLQGQNEVNVEFVYDNATFYKENMTEEQYIEKQYGEAEEKSKGSGDTWKKKWASAKETIWQPKFLELMNRYFQDEHNLSFQEGLSDAKYTLIVDTVWLYPGWDAAVCNDTAKAYA